MKVSKKKRGQRDFRKEDFVVIGGHGFSDDDIWDVARFRRCSRCRPDAKRHRVRPNDEFYMMDACRNSPGYEMQFGD